MSNSYGERFKITIFGQSHADAIGVVIEGIPAGIALDLPAIRAMLARRAPGSAPYATARKEPDHPEIVSGVIGGVTCGTPLCAIIRNKNTRSGDYDALRTIPRPAHADYPAYVKYGGANDHRGGGGFSGRMTAPMVFAGAVAMQLLKEKGVTIGAHIAQIGTVKDELFDAVHVDAPTLEALKEKSFCTLNDAAGEKMKKDIAAAKENGDSLGGLIECAALGVPVGAGEPMFGGLENEIARCVFAIPAVKGIEFGSGFAGAALRGSENNDPFCAENGAVRTESNRHGGILGGLASGMPIVFRAAFKPTPSIALPQRSVNLATGEPVTLEIAGRHDPCVVPRAVPCIEAACAIALANLMM